MEINRKVEKIRSLMKDDGLDAWIIYGSDPHNSEYVCPRWRTRNFVSGFSGSAGTVVITEKEALLWTDSRYFIQAAKQLSGTEYKLMKMGQPSVLDYVTYLKTNKYIKKVGTSGDTLMKAVYTDLTENGINIVPTRDYLDEIWEDREKVPNKPVKRMDDSICGFSAKEKLEQIRKICKEKGVDNYLISSLDDIAWTLNFRGSDIDYNPVFLSYLLLLEDKTILFADKVRFNDDDYDYLASFLTILPYSKISEYLSNLPNNLKVILNEKKTNMLNFKSFPKDTEFFDMMDITSELKTSKNSVEIEGMKKAHIADGIAYAAFRSKLEKMKNLSEIDVQNLFAEERAKQPFLKYLGPSFGPISAFSDHGPMCHYSATQESNSKIEGDGLLVLDTGGQYDCGMTDLTRTLLFGKASEEEKKDYTLVLKGHLALSRIHFPEGTTGMQLDVLARQFLWKEGMTFTHGTGHGVGFHLCVHEGPAYITIGKTALYPMKEGVVISDEPGLYKENRHGIRIENLIYVKKAEKTEFGQFYEFSDLTLIPYERDLIDINLLSEEEIKQINDYHSWVLDSLKEKVTEDGRKFLLKATKPLLKNSKL